MTFFYLYELSIERAVVQFHLQVRRCFPGIPSNRRFLRIHFLYIYLRFSYIYLAGLMSSSVRFVIHCP